MSARYPCGIPDEALVHPVHPHMAGKGEKFRARMRHWMGPPPGPGEDGSVQPPHSKFHPVPVRPIFGFDTAPIEPQFPTLVPPKTSEHVGTGLSRVAVEAKKWESQPEKKPEKKKVPIQKWKKRTAQAKFEQKVAEPKVIHTSTLPRFRTLRR